MNKSEDEEEMTNLAVIAANKFYLYNTKYDIKFEDFEKTLNFEVIKIYISKRDDVYAFIKLDTFIPISCKNAINREPLTLFEFDSVKKSKINLTNRIKKGDCFINTKYSRPYINTVFTSDVHFINKRKQEVLKQKLSQIDLEPTCLSKIIKRLQKSIENLRKYFNFTFDKSDITCVFLSYEQGLIRYEMPIETVKENVSFIDYKGVIFNKDKKDIKLVIQYDIYKKFFSFGIECRHILSLNPPVFSYNIFMYHVYKINGNDINKPMIENLSNLTVQVILCLRRYLVKDVAVLIAKIYHENNIVI